MIILKFIIGFLLVGSILLAGFSMIAMGILVYKANNGKSNQDEAKDE